MNYSIKETVVKFTSNKPNTMKKIFILCLIVAYFGYIIATKGIKNSIWEFVFVLFSFGLSLCFISFRSKVKNPIILIKLFFKSMSRKKILDALPVEMNITEEQIKVKIKSAEKIKKKVIDETFIFNKSDIAEINIFTLDNLVNIRANKYSVVLEGDNYKKEIGNGKTEVYIYLHEQGPEIFEKIKSCGYEVVDAKAETQKERDYQKQRKKDIEAKREERKKAEEDQNYFEKKVNEMQKKNPELTNTLDTMINGFEPENDSSKSF